MLALLLVTASTSAFIAPVHKTARIHRATEAPELDDEALSALSTAATRMQLEGRFSRSVTQRVRRYLPYAQAARWARGLGLSTEQDWLDWVGLGEGKNTYVPSRPGDYYGGRGEWISWAHYLVGDTDEVVAPQLEVLPQEYFAELNYGSDAVPWDLRGKPQPAVRKAWAAGAFRNCREILDCGCGAGPASFTRCGDGAPPARHRRFSCAGAGDNANYLASRGHTVVGFDLSPSAVASARERAASLVSEFEEAGGSVRFEVASCTDLLDSPVYDVADAIGGFPVALDSALLHCLDDKTQRRYVGELAKVVRTGGRLYVGCFSDANPDPWSNPRRLSEAHLRALFAGPAWRVETIEPAWYERPRALNEGHRSGAWTMAWWCSVTRLGAM